MKQDVTTGGTIDRQFHLLYLVLIILIGVSGVFGAGEFDPTFDGGAFQTANRNISTVVPLPDGKYLIGGNFFVVNGKLRYTMARLNADATVDPSFNPPTMSAWVVKIVPQPDGKLLVGGNFIHPITETYTLLARFNADGSLDPTFTALPALHGSPDNVVRDIVITADGKIVIAGSFVDQSGTRSKLARLNNNGSPDTTFAPPGVLSNIKDLELQPDGKIIGMLTDGGSGSVFLKRLNADGTVDAFFNAFVTGSVNAIRVQPDGKIMIGGDFTFVNNTARIDAARLNADGSLDPSFSITTTGSVGNVTLLNAIELYADGRILLGGSFVTINGESQNNLARVDANGNHDSSFNVDLGHLEAVNVIVPRSDGSFVLSVGISPQFGADDKLILVTATGARDASFLGLAGSFATVREALVQPDGKILVVGNFGAIEGILRPRLARFNPDGTADETFAPVISPANSPVVSAWALALQADGKILVGDQPFFTGQKPIRRFHPNGSEDSSFNAPISGQTIIVRDIAVQPDGKILVAGDTDGCNCFVRRLNGDGSADPTFSTTVNGKTNRVVIEHDGKIILAGTFGTVNGIPRGRIARLNSDGTLDATFNPLGGATGEIFALELQPDGKMIIGGTFVSFNGTPRSFIARVNPDGTLDESFTAVADNFVRSITLEAGGKIIIGGDFTSVNNVLLNKIARLNPDGTLDSTFHIGSAIAGAVYGIALQPDNKIIAVGNFFKYNGHPALSVARLNNNLAGRAMFDFDGDARSDVAVFRPSNGYWYQLRSSDSGFSALQFGQAGDSLAAADYDGDGKTDVAVFRDTVPGAGTFGYFYITNSADGSISAVQFGSTDDVPISGDWDGDGKADLAVYRRGVLATDQSYIYYRPSGSPGVDFRQFVWGAGGDKPVVGDFDGDGKLDPAVFRPSNSYWYILRSSDGQILQEPFGLATDVPVPADFDGDGSANIAVFRPSTGIWYTSTNPATNYGAVQFGAVGDLPVPADYDGDGRADVAVFRPSNGSWYMLRSASGFTAVQFGTNGDKPVPNAFIP